MSTETDHLPRHRTASRATFTPDAPGGQADAGVFTAQINNPHTRAPTSPPPAALRLVPGSPHRPARRGGSRSRRRFHQDLQGQLAPATVKQHLAALRVPV